MSMKKTTHGDGTVEWWNGQLLVQLTTTGQIRAYKHIDGPTWKELAPLPDELIDALVAARDLRNERKVLR